MTDWTKFPLPLQLELIFALDSHAEIEHELGNHCFSKKIRFSQNLTDVEAIFYRMQCIGSSIMGDGFCHFFMKYSHLRILRKSAMHLTKLED